MDGGSGGGEGGEQKEEEVGWMWLEADGRPTGQTDDQHDGEFMAAVAEASSTGTAASVTALTPHNQTNLKPPPSPKKGGAGSRQGNLLTSLPGEVSPRGLSSVGGGGRGGERARGREDAGQQSRIVMGKSVMERQPGSHPPQAWARGSGRARGTRPAGPTCRASCSPGIWR